MKEILDHFKRLDDLSPFDNPQYLHDLNLISASVKKLCPKLRFSEHIEIAKESWFCQKLANYDVSNLELIESAPTPDVDLKNKVLVTFHYSSYRMINSLLSSWKIPFKLVADSSFIQREGKTILQSYHQINSQLGTPIFDFEIINAEDKSVIMKCLDSLRKGYSLLFYADGNSGVGGMIRSEEKMTKIEVMGGQVYARKGIAVLSSLFQKPIHVLTVVRNMNPDGIEFQQTKVPYLDDRRSAEAISETTQRIFRPLSDLLQVSPGRWEGWFYYHNFIDFSLGPELSEPDRKDYIFNHFNFGIGRIGKDFYYLLNKNTLKFTRISEELFEYILETIRKNKVEKKLPVLKALYASQIFLYL